MNYHTLQGILKVVSRSCLIMNDELIFCQVFDRKTFFFHLVEKILPLDILGGILLHVQLHRELTVVIYLELRHGVKIELKSFKFQEKDIG
jgi:hypothetical protein